MSAEQVAPPKKLATALASTLTQIFQLPDKQPPTFCLTWCQNICLRLQTYRDLPFISLIIIAGDTDSINTMIIIFKPVALAVQQINFSLLIGPNHMGNFFWLEVWAYYWIWKGLIYVMLISFLVSVDASWFHVLYLLGPRQTPSRI